MDERRYSDAEVAAILSRAAERERQGLLPAPQAESESESDALEMVRAPAEIPTVERKV